jgi:hypothetical protein
VVLKIAIMVVVPDEPGIVSQQKLRYKFESIEALKKEVIYFLLLYLIEF